MRDRLAERGHTVVAEARSPGDEPFARVSAVAVTHPADGAARTAASDPPWSTAAGGC